MNKCMNSQRGSFGYWSTREKRNGREFSVDCFNTLTLIFPPLYFSSLQEQKSEL